MDEDLRAAIRADQQRRADFDAKVEAGIAAGLCKWCARGNHTEHVTEWRPSVLGGEVINGAGRCVPLDPQVQCACEWRA